MPTTDQYVPEQAYDYEWMNAADQFGNLLEEFLPIFKDYGILPRPGGGADAPQQSIVVRPTPQEPVVVTPQWYDQIPPWGWGLVGLAGGVLVLSLLRR